MGETGSEFRAEDLVEFPAAVTGAGHDGEVAHQQEPFPILPGPNLVKGVLAADEVQLESF